MNGVLYVVGAVLSFALLVRFARIMDFPAEGVMLLVLASALWPITVPIAWAIVYLEAE